MADNTQDPTDLRAISLRFVDVYYSLVQRRVVRSRREFCDAVGLHPSSFSKIESGKINCTMRALCSAMKVYNVRPLWLLMADGDMFE